MKSQIKFSVMTPAALVALLSMMPGVNADEYIQRTYTTTTPSGYVLIPAQKEIVRNSVAPGVVEYRHVVRPTSSSLTIERSQLPLLADTVVEKDVVIESQPDPVVIEKTVEKPVVIEKTVEKPVVIKEKKDDHHLLNIGIPFAHLKAL